MKTMQRPKLQLFLCCMFLACSHGAINPQKSPVPWIPPDTTLTDLEAAVAGSFILMIFRK
jgi:hypothetical protein